VFSFGGAGLTYRDRIKLVFAAAGCTRPGLGGAEADAHGVVRGGEAAPFERINALRTNASLAFTVAEGAGAGLLLCYRYDGSPWGGEYRPVGNVTIANQPPVVAAFAPQVSHPTFRDEK
jgi:hypothetical protein